MATTLAGKVALVTGGARRVGAEVSRVLHRAGATLILHYHQSGTEANALCAEFNRARPNSAVALQCDLRDTASLQTRVRDAVTPLERLDVVVNNASCFIPTALATTDHDTFNALFAVNVAAPYFLCQTAAPWLGKTRGCIINITDIYADRPLNGYALYCASRAALVNLTRSLALELGPEVRANAIAPGAILWPENTPDEHDNVARQRLIARTPLKRIGTPADIAAAVHFLATEPFITGQVLNIDGGRSIAMT